MKNNVNYKCITCGKKHALNSMKWRCDCGGLFDLDFKSEIIDFNKIKSEGVNSLWRYKDSMPFSDEDEIIINITMGEGMTPLLYLEPENKNLLVKADYYMPTLSFKDRGAVALVALAKKLGVDNMVADSSGNAGTAISAYASRSNIKCDVFVPDSTSDKKIQQISAHGAIIHRISGTREDTANAAISMVEQKNIFYASHIYNPFFHEGTKSYFFEVFEQMNYKMPDVFIVPVGNGTLFLGAYRAFTQLLEWGFIEKYPKIVVVQSENCAPIKKSFDNGLDEVLAVDNTGTLAEGIAIAAPARGTQILNIIKSIDAAILTVNDAEIISARNAMAKSGFYVEITSAANYAGYLKYINENNEHLNETIVLPLCGAGIKS